MYRVGDILVCKEIISINPDTKEELDRVIDEGDMYEIIEINDDDTVWTSHMTNESNALIYSEPLKFPINILNIIFYCQRVDRLLKLKKLND